MRLQMGPSSRGGPARLPAIERNETAEASLLVVGTSFRTAGVETRERIAAHLSGLPELVFRATGRAVPESATIETCNRLELYLVSCQPDEVTRSLVARFASSGIAPQSFYVKTGLDAVRHIFRVASGLDSPVLGEEQILDQVRDAGKTARTVGQARSILSSLFDAAYSLGKRVRETYLAPATNRSVSVFALRHALRELGRRPATVLLIGSGETAKLAAMKLKGSAIYLLSARREIETRFPGAVRVSRRNLREVTQRSDLIIAATRHHGYVLTMRDLPRKRKLVILDLGFPRNVDPSVESNRVKLYNLDAVAEWALSSGTRADSSAEDSVEEEARRFDAWLRASRLTPTLANIYRWGGRIRAEETAAALRRLPHLSEHERAVVESLGRRLTGKLLSPHVTFVKEVTDGEDQSKRLLLLESIFRDGRR